LELGYLHNFSIFVAAMVKKGIIFIMAMLYICITAGIAVNIHYCMDRIASVSFGHEKDHADGSCSKCGMSKTENHCCKDESFFVKLSDTHQPSVFIHDLESENLALPVEFVNLTVTEQGITMLPFADHSSPPPPNLNKVYLANRVFRI
jgi:hypothetical protein